MYFHVGWSQVFGTRGANIVTSRSFDQAIYLAFFCPKNTFIFEILQQSLCKFRGFIPGSFNPNATSPANFPPRPNMWRIPSSIRLQHLWYLKPWRGRIWMFWILKEIQVSSQNFWKLSFKRLNVLLKDDQPHQFKSAWFIGCLDTIVMLLELHCGFHSARKFSSNLTN